MLRCAGSLSSPDPSPHSPSCHQRARCQEGGCPGCPGPCGSGPALGQAEALSGEASNPLPGPPSRQHGCCQEVPPAVSLLLRGRLLPSAAVLRLCVLASQEPVSWRHLDCSVPLSGPPNLCRLPLDSLKMVDRPSRLPSPQALLPTGACPQRAIPPCSRTFHGCECPPQTSSARPGSR